jgi:hypothetical protein
LSEQRQGYPHYKRGTLFYKSNGLSVALSMALTSRFCVSNERGGQMTNIVEEQSKWTLTFDFGEGQLQWNTDTALWEATAMLEGLFRGLGIAGAAIASYIRKNHEGRVCVRCNSSGLTIYEGMLGHLAQIALDELADEELQNEKRSAPAQGRGTR